MSSVQSPRISPRYQAHKRRADSLLEHLCLLRGLREEELSPDYRSQLHNPNLLPDMDKARELMRQAVDGHWRVGVFGDYDADGTPATALLVELLRLLGLEHVAVLPTRESGYGLRQTHVKEFAKSCQLLITVDTGISSVEEISLAKELGLKVIVLDHHLPPSSLPPADALVDPHLAESKYPFKDLCGCALAYKYTTALQDDFTEITESFCKWQLDLVAVSTVADMMPLVGENRTLVHYGLIVLRQQRRPGLRALLQNAGIRPESISSSTLGFVIGPRLNASGRLGDNSPALDLLTTRDVREAERLAKILEQNNTERQELVEKTLSSAKQLLMLQNKPDDRVFFVQAPDWPTGVIGLVAGKLVAQYNRPVVVGSSIGNEIRASARSVDKLPLVDALSEHGSLLGNYGGHRQAAGLSTSLENWQNLSIAMKGYATKFLKEDDLCRTFTADAVAVSGDLSLKVADSLEKLSPFGLANNRPLLLLQEATVDEVRFIGGGNRHLRLQLNSELGRIEGIGFDLGERYRSSPVNDGSFLGYLENNRWNNQERLQLRLIDFQPPGLEVSLID